MSHKAPLYNNQNEHFDALLLMDMLKQQALTVCETCYMEVLHDASSFSMQANSHITQKRRIKIFIEVEI
jgi:hypothetical protein